MNETLEWMRLRITLGAHRAAERCRVARRYYRCRLFRQADLRLTLISWWMNPYRVSRQFLQSRGDTDIHVYGETPLTTLEVIAERCQLTPNDLLYDLGCGPGRTSFWFHSLIGCRVFGIEQIPAFTKMAQRVAYQINAGREIQFTCADLLQADYSKATAIYLYGTCFDESFITKLNKAFLSLPKGAKVITVSYPLTDYLGGEIFCLRENFPARFPWGEGEIYLQVRI